jgi:transcriptional regulator with XRE-family HTH domain
MTRKTIGEAIKHWRKGRGLSQRRLAERTGLHYVHVGRLERGEGNPTLATLETLAKVLGKRMVDFFTRPAKAKQPPPRRASAHRRTPRCERRNPTRRTGTVRGG